VQPDADSARQGFEGSLLQHPPSLLICLLAQECRDFKILHAAG
jgi:hypothetical protein